MGANLQSSSAHRILVMGSNPDRSWIGECLQQHGYQIYAVAGLAGVLKNARAFRPAAAIVDLDEPTMGGDHLIRVLKHTYPALPMIALSNTIDVVIAQIIEEFRIPLLVKPHTAASLLDALARLGVAEPQPLRDVSSTPISPV